MPLERVLMVVKTYPGHHPWPSHRLTSPHLHKLIQGHGPPQDDLKGALDAGDGLEIGDAFPFYGSV
jgi:hypothetical protein